MNRLARADVIVVGPAPPMRGGIAQHTSRLVEAFEARGARTLAISYRRLYPAALFPGRDQWTREARPAWSIEALDTLGPASWLAVRRELAASKALVVVQWWHPVVAPAVRIATGGVASERLVAICHNVLPHERVPGQTPAARSVLGRPARVVFHGRAELEVARRVLGAANETWDRGVPVPLPCVLPFESLASGELPPELRSATPAAPTSRIVAAAGHLRSYKGLSELVSAWTSARRPPDARLVIAGESYLGRREHRELLRAIREDSSILLIDRYLGDHELVSFLKCAEVLVLPHVAASQSGLVPIARAVGLPVLVSDAGALAEQAGERGEAVGRGDVRSLAVALERRLAAPPRPRDASMTHRQFLEAWQLVVEAIAPTARP